MSFFFSKNICILSIVLLLFIGGCEKHNSQSPDGEDFDFINLIYPKAIAENAEIPIILIDSSVNPRQSIWALYSIIETGSNIEEFFGKRGRGSVSMKGYQGGELQLYSNSFSTSLIKTFSVQVRPQSQMRELAGILSGGDLVWDSTQIVHLTADVTIPTGATLTVGMGTIVLSDLYVSLTIYGNIEVSGSREYPVIFTSSDSANPWGEIYHRGSTGNYHYTFFTNGGGDASRKFGHSNSQPVLGGDICSLLLDNVYLIDNPGKAMGLDSSVIEMDSCLISRCDTGGELIRTLAHIDGCYFLDMPNGDSIEVDDDNDGLYLFYAWCGGPDTSTVTNCVFASGKDDGLDHNGAILKISNCIFEDFDNEGIATSNLNCAVIYNCLVKACEQGIEAGFGSPNVFVNHCTLIGNETGLRFGDWYDWGCSGHLTAINTVVANSSLHNVWNFDVESGGSIPNALEITYSLVNESEYDSGAGCITGTAIFNDEYELMPNSPGYGAGADGMSMGILP